jgi:hypothetical protein
MGVFRSLLIALCAATAVPLFGAHLRVQGGVTGWTDGRPMEGALVRVYRDGVKQQEFRTGHNGRYTVLLDNNANYVLRFSLPEHVTKSFSIATHGPAWENDQRTVDVEVEVVLFERVPGIDFSFFDLPLGLARFTPMTGHLAWDRNYEERVRPEVDRLMHELALRREQQVLSFAAPTAPPMQGR